MSDEFQVSGNNAAALFTLKVHRGDGMALLAMNWKKNQPPQDFVGFGIEYKEPGGKKFFPLRNRLTFAGAPSGDDDALSTLRSPIQKFRWVHFPRNANLEGDFIYRVTPLFMDAQDKISPGKIQEVAIELRRETYPGKLNVTFTRGFVSSQAFVDRYEKAGPIETLVCPKAAGGLTFVATHPKRKEALAWMGFEAREEILTLLDEAIEDKNAKVRVVAYDLNEPEVVSRLVKLGERLKVIIDDSADHGKGRSAENMAAKMLTASAGKNNVKRQHMRNLQHNKTIVVDGPKVKKAVCGSTNLSWRGLYVQANNAIVLQGEKPVSLFMAAFEDYWTQTAFNATKSAALTSLGLDGIDAQVAFSPHSTANTMLQKIADDLETKTTSSLLYSLAFLSQTPGAILDAIEKVSNDDDIFVYGIADKEVGGLDLQTPDGFKVPVFASALGKDAPAPFSKEPIGGGGTRMHHKFLVIDFDKPTARVYMGSYNFSVAADGSNGENLLLIRDRRIAVSYMIEALRIFDHYHFRIAWAKAKKKNERLELAKPPRKPGEKPWWDKDYTDPRRIKDRALFA